MTIPGRLDWRDVREAIVEQEPLRNRHEFREQAHQLESLGLDVGAIARALGLRRQAIRELLGEPVRDAKGRPRRVQD